MSIINPLTPAPPNIAVQPTTNPVATVEERQLDLRLEQMVRATVVEGGLDRALLEMNHRHYLARTEQQLQTGQKLTLLVLKTHPTLEMQVLRDPLGGRIGQFLALLGSSYDWSGLLNNLQRQQLPPNLPADTLQVYQQLQKLLQPQGQLTTVSGVDPEKISTQLQQLAQAITGERATTGLQGGAETQAHAVYRNNAAPLPNLPRILQGLQEQLSKLQQAPDRSVPQAWSDQIHQLLVPLQQSLPRLQLELPRLDNLFALLGQLRQQPNLPPKLTAELDRLILLLQSPGGRPLTDAQQSASAEKSAPQLQQPVTPGPAPPAATAIEAQQPVVAQGKVDPATAPIDGAVNSQAAASPVRPSGLAAEISTDLEKLVAQLSQGQDKSAKLAPKILGQLEGLLGKLQQLPQAERAVLLPLPALENLTAQLSQLIQLGPQRPEGGSLGFLSQLFGFHLEAALLQAKKQDALASLKLSLLSMQKELGEQVEEPLRRIEMFQLCKARLAEEQVQFLPLPFNELEEGYLLMEKPGQQEGQDSEPPLQLSLSLRLSALGNMRVEMLYEKQGLHLRLACEDKEKMAYLQESAAELKESLESVALQGISFAADARGPARQLLERLLPEAVGMLDARI